MSLKGYLTKQKRKYDSDVGNEAHSVRQQPLSNYPFQFLSPASKKARVDNIRKEN